MGTINVVPVSHHILHDHNQLSFPTFLSISRNNIYLYESSAQINNLLWSLCGCTVSFREEEEEVEWAQWRSHVLLCSAAIDQEVIH